MNIDVKSVDISTLVTAIGGILVAVVAGISTYSAGHKKARSDVQLALNDGFKILISELQEERASLMAVVKEQDARIELLEMILRQNGISLPLSTKHGN